MAEQLPTATACAWCLSTPPRHDRCTGDATKTGWAETNWYAPATGLPCDCPCRLQDPLW